MLGEAAMEDLQGETRGNAEIRTQTSEGAETSDFAHTLSSQTWSSSSNKPTPAGLPSEVASEDTALFAVFPEPQMAFILKIAASLLQPGCLGGSPVAQPDHLQVEAGSDTHGSQTLATPVIAPCLGSLSLPLIFDQSVVQYISSQLLAQSSCLIPEQLCLQNLSGPDAMLQSMSVPSSQTLYSDVKSNPSSTLPDNPALHTSEFTAAFQELFSKLRSYISSSCQGIRLPLNPASEAFFHPESSLPYLHPVSPPVCLVPPATLLVPFPFLIPLPVPIPIPIPIPVYDIKKSESTQTPTEHIGASIKTHGPNSDNYSLQFPILPPLSAAQEVLDLSVKVIPIHRKQERLCSVPQDSALDLSVSCKPCTDAHSSTNREQVTQSHHP